MSFKNDNLCMKLYKHIIYFIKNNNIKDVEDNKNVKIILRDIETVFKNYGF